MNSALYATTLAKSLIDLVDEAPAPKEDISLKQALVSMLPEFVTIKKTGDLKSEG